MIYANNRKPVSISCSHCRAECSFMVNPEDIIRWQSGDDIQDCMPDLSAVERELFISRTCYNCWKDMPFVPSDWPGCCGDDDEE